MHEGKNMGIMTTLKKPTAEKGGPVPSGPSVQWGVDGHAGWALWLRGTSNRSMILVLERIQCPELPADLRRDSITSGSRCSYERQVQTTVPAGVISWTTVAKITPSTSVPSRPPGCAGRDPRGRVQRSGRPCCRCAGGRHRGGGRHGGTPRPCCQAQSTSKIAPPLNKPQPGGRTGSSTSGISLRRTDGRSAAGNRAARVGRAAATPSRRSREVDKVDLPRPGQRREQRVTRKGLRGVAEPQPGTTATDRILIGNRDDVCHDDAPYACVRERSGRVSCPADVWRMRDR